MDSSSVSLVSPSHRDNMCGRRVLCVFCASLLRRRSMPHKGWSTVEVSSSAVAAREGPVEARSEAEFEGWSAANHTSSTSTSVRGDPLPRCPHWPPRKSLASEPQLQIRPWTSGSRMWRHSLLGHRVLQQNPPRSEQELAQEDLVGFRQEAEVMQASGSGAPIDPVSALEAKL